MEKRSIGIACCRKNDKNNYEILLVQRRLTYSFQEFVLGVYKLKSLKKIKHMIKNMTSVEQTEILTLNFEMLWWRVTFKSKNDNLELYNSKLDKFNKFIKTYNVKSLINQSACSLPLWEIPKGRHISHKETDINCAIREFSEETNIEKSFYRIIFNPVVYSYQENNITYIIKYYPAVCKYLPHIGRIQPTKNNQTCEIVEMRWMDVNMVKALTNKRLEKLFNRIIYNLTHEPCHFQQSFTRQLL